MVEFEERRGPDSSPARSSAALHLAAAAVLCTAFSPDGTLAQVEPERLGEASALVVERPDPRLLPATVASNGPPPLGAVLYGREVEEDRPSTALMIAGGLLGGGIGVLGGGYLGAAIVDDTCQGEGCLAGIIQGAFIGAAAAESALLPLGVHVAAGGEGDYGTSVLASAGLGAAAVGIAYATRVDDPFGAVLLAAIPALQLTVSIGEHR